MWPMATSDGSWRNMYCEVRQASIVNRKQEQSTASRSLEIEGGEQDPGAVGGFRVVVAANHV